MIVVFWLDANGVTQHLELNADQLTEALKHCEVLRKQGNRHVTISSELGNSVGKPGVDTVADGMTPDGVAYTWKKRRL
jgi:hypothetical protein